MAKVILKDASVTINGVDLSDHVDSVEISEKWDNKDVTSMGATMKQYLLGLGDGSIKVDFFQDFAAASVDATLSALAGSNTTFTVVCKPTSAAVSATNPSYTMTAVLPEYQPLSGKVGDPSKLSVTFMNNGSSGIVRATS